MELTDSIRAQIDQMPLDALLRRWRFAPAGDTMFNGDSGAYYLQRLQQARTADPAAWTAASKRVGWDQ